MALIEKHPDVTDYFVELELDEIRERGGVADLVETGHIVIVKDVRLSTDLEVLGRLSRSIDSVSDNMIRRKLKKLESTHFLDGPPPAVKGRRLAFKSPLRQAVFDVLCHGDPQLFSQACAAIRDAHEGALEIFGKAFPNYEPFRLIPSLRLTTTLFENLHWDNHQIDDDFHQARVFANLDSRPRIWHVGERLPTLVRRLYREQNLERFAGRDPNELVSFITGDLLGGNVEKWRDTLPRHKVAFEPGEVWLGESRIVAHQIYYGEAALVYMWFVKAASMHDPSNRFNAQIEQVHRDMAASAANAA